MYPTEKILLQILKESSSRNKTLGKTELIKYLYLTEVEYYRVNRERLTDLKWLFHLYGPYAYELEDTLKLPVFQKLIIETGNDREFIKYKVAEPNNDYRQYVDPKLSVLIKKIVGQWKDKDFAELLDYVYFETEPMQFIENRGEQLDFSTIIKETLTVVVPLKASKETERRVAELRKQLAPALKRLGEKRTTERQEGNEYKEAKEAWDEEMSKDIDPEVYKKIFITITKPFYGSGKEGN
ncbi:MAG: SocA family protein [Bacteroidetes bacterium]|nr:SocA family protein [Bacteroidota bacterium]